MARFNKLKSLIFDGGDWYDIPPPSNAQFNGDWEIEFDLELTRPWPADLMEPIAIGSFDGLVSSYFALEASLPDGAVTWMNIGLMVITSDDTWLDDYSGFNIPLTGTTLHHLKCVKSGNIITFTWTDHLDVDHVMQADMTGKSFDISSEPVATFGASRSEYWNFDDDPWWHVPDNGKIKNFTSTFWEFERAFKDKNHTLAEEGDLICQIMNAGSLGKRFVQDTESMQAVLDSFKSFELLSLNSKLPARITTGHAVFNGSSSKINCGDSDYFSFGNGSDDSPFSLGVWIKFLSASATMSIISKGSYWTNAEYHLYKTTNGNIIFRIYDNSTGNSFLGRYIAAGGTLDVWMHLLITYAGNALESGIKIYKNGVRADGNSASGGSSYVAMENLAESLYLGHHVGDSLFLDAHVRDVKIFDIELTAEQALEEYQNQSLLSNLVAYYKLPLSFVDSGPNDLDALGTNVTIVCPRSGLALKSKL